MNHPLTSEVWGPYCTVEPRCRFDHPGTYVHVVYPTASAQILDNGEVRSATDEELDMIARAHYQALTESFAQSRRENDPDIYDQTSD